MHKIDPRQRRRKRVRKKIFGTQERPRLNVYKSNKHIYVQIIDDMAGCTLVSASSLEGELRTKNVNCELSKQVGLLVGRRAIERGISKIVFDRSGYKFHGNIKYVAEGARECGLLF